MSNLKCGGDLFSLSKKNCKFVPGAILGWLAFPNARTIPIADLNDKDKVQAFLDEPNDTRAILIYPAMPLNSTPTRDDAEFLTGDTGLDVRIKKAKPSIDVEWQNVSPCFANSIVKSIDNTKLHLISLHENGAMTGGGDDKNVKTFPVNIYVEDLFPGENPSIFTVKAKIKYIASTGYMNSFADPSELETGAWLPLDDLYPVTPVLLENITANATAGTIEFDAVGNCSGAEITSFITETDWLVATTTAPMTYLVPTALTNVENHYILTVTGLTAVEHNLGRKSNYLATDKGYELVKTYSVTPV